MPLKTNKCCCCDDPCDLTSQGVCCQCVPRRICIHPYGCDCDGGAATLEWSEANKEYTGTVVCGDGTSIDVTLTFERVSGQCQMVLASTCAGLTSGAELREDVTCPNINVEFTIPDPSGCGDPYCTSLRLVVTPAPDITPDCDGCDCTCRDACLFIFEDPTGCSGKAVVTVSEADWSWTYTFACEDINGSPTGENIDLTFYLDTDSAGNCVFKVESVFLGIEKTDSDYWKTPDCPDFHVFWDLVAISGRTWIFGISCAWCGDCEDIACCNTDIPRLLYATVTGGNCACAQGAVIPLIYDDPSTGGTGDWVAEGFETDCGIPWTLRLACASQTRCHFTLQFEGNVCTNDLVDIDENNGDPCQCDPLELVFDVTTGGIGCCGLMGTVTIQFTITE